MQDTLHSLFSPHFSAFLMTRTFSPTQLERELEVEHTSFSVKRLEGVLEISCSERGWRLL